MPRSFLIPPLRMEKTPRGRFFSIPSTRRGRIRLAGLVAYSVIGTVFPALPIAVKALATAVPGLFHWMQ